MAKKHRHKVKFGSVAQVTRRPKPRGQTPWGVRKGTILETITRTLAVPGGATFRELVNTCERKHPSRDPVSLAASIRTQLYRLPREHAGIKILRVGRAYQLVPKAWHTRA